MGFASSSLADAQKYNYIPKSKASRADSYIPFDTDLGSSRTFVATPANAKHIHNVNRHLKNGERNKALYILRLANIDVTMTTASLPIQFAKSQITKAKEQVVDGKFYEANRSLIEVEDSVKIDKLDIVGEPSKAVLKK